MVLKAFKRKRKAIPPHQGLLEEKHIAARTKAEILKKEEDRESQLEILNYLKGKDDGREQV